MQKERRRNHDCKDWIDWNVETTYWENIEDLIETGDVQEVLDVIDDVIVDNILANNDEPDDEGVKLQKIYDEIFNQN